MAFEAYYPGSRFISIYNGATLNIYNLTESTAIASNGMNLNGDPFDMESMLDVVESHYQDSQSLNCL